MNQSMGEWDGKTEVVGLLNEARKACAAADI